MSNSKNARYLKKIPFWLAIVIMLAAAIILIVAVSILASIPESAPPKVGNGQTSSTGNNGASQQVFSYIGDIQSKSENSFIIKAQASKNQLDKDTLITVKVTPATQYLSTSVPQTLPSNPDQATLNNLFKTQAISYNDLKVGDEVTAVSQVDVKAKTEMEAIRIQKINIK